MRTIITLLTRVYKKVFRIRDTYLDCKDICGVLNRAELDIDNTLKNTDWTGKGTTSDQACIEAVLDGLDLTGKRILHVGVGNSKFAQRFAERASWIDGITAGSNEKRWADSLSIPNYRTHLVSKHSREFVLCLTDKYDFIVDNNLTSFACCKFHFFLMLDTYLWSLNPGGHIITDRKGMGWVVPGEDRRWRLTFEDLVGLEQVFPVTAVKLSETVFSVRRCR